MNAFKSRFVCCHTLYPSLLCCSEQAWLWSACCWCVIHWKTAPVVLMFVSLSLSAVWLLYFTLERSLQAAWRVLGGEGGTWTRRQPNARTRVVSSKVPDMKGIMSADMNTIIVYLSTEMYTDRSSKYLDITFCVMSPCAHFMKCFITDQWCVMRLWKTLSQ